MVCYLGVGHIDLVCSTVLGIFMPRSHALRENVCFAALRQMFETQSVEVVCGS